MWWSRPSHWKAAGPGSRRVRPAACVTGERHARRAGTRRRRHRSSVVYSARTSRRNRLIPPVIDLSDQLCVLDVVAPHELRGTGTERCTTAGTHVGEDVLDAPARVPVHPTGRGREGQHVFALASNAARSGVTSAHDCLPFWNRQSLSLKPSIAFRKASPGVHHRREPAAVSAAVHTTRWSISASDFWTADSPPVTRHVRAAARRRRAVLACAVSSVSRTRSRMHWAVTRHADIQVRQPAHRDLQLGFGHERRPPSAEIQQATSFFLSMDPPEHTLYRRLISAAFTPKQVRRIEAQIQANAADIVDRLIESCATVRKSTSSANARPSFRCGPSRT